MAGLGFIVAVCFVVVVAVVVCIQRIGPGGGRQLVQRQTGGWLCRRSGRSTVTFQ